MKDELGRDMRSIGKHDEEWDRRWDRRWDREQEVMSYMNVMDGWKTRVATYIPIATVCSKYMTWYRNIYRILYICK